MGHDWYKTFFQGIVLDMWRKAVTPEQTRAEADSLERYLRLRPGARVLDVPPHPHARAPDRAQPSADP